MADFKRILVPTDFTETSNGRSTMRCRWPSVWAPR